MTDAVYLPCRFCGEPRSNADVGSGLCLACRRVKGEATSHEIAAAVKRLNRSEGGRSARVRWLTLRAPQHLWFRSPPAKEQPVRVIVLQLDEWPA